MEKDSNMSDKKYYPFKFKILLILIYKNHYLKSSSSRFSSKFLRGLNYFGHQSSNGHSTKMCLTFVIAAQQSHVGLFSVFHISNIS